MLGYLFAFAAAFTISVEVVFGRFALLEWGANSLVFILIALFSSSLIQLTVAGYSHGGWLVKSLKKLHTWGYTLLQIGMYMTAFMMFLYITNTEANTLARFSIITSILLSWVVVGRKPSLTDLPWLAIIFAACIAIIVRTDPAFMPFLIALLIINSLCQAGRSIIAETHPTYLQASNLFERLRVTGTIMLVTSFAMLCIFFALAALKPETSALAIFQIAPDVSDFLRKETFYAGLFVGVVILPFDIYVNFRATSLLNAERALMLRAFVPLITLLVEYPVSLLSEKMSMASLAPIDIIAGASIICASIGLLWGRKHISASIAQKITDTEDEDLYDPKQAKNDLEVINHTLEFTKGDIKKTGKLLGLSADTVEMLLNDKTHILTTEASRLMNNNFAKKVAYLDALTGLVNKAHFNALFRESLKAKKGGAVLFIDLNKFKPVNDTYGHEAGDEALQVIAQRLQGLAKKGMVISRLGGDEFAVLLPNTTKEAAQEIADKIIEQIELPVTLSSANNAEAQLGASIGLACFPEDGTDADTLLHVADERMYGQKKER
jgi:diguanylate cyclase (GGDEF)-like protein